MSQHITPQELAKKLQDDIQGIFPRSLVSAKTSAKFGCTIQINFTIGLQSEWAHSIELNDFARHVIIIWLSNDSKMPETMPEKVKVEGCKAGSFTIQTESWPYCKGHKTGWRDFSGDAKTIQKRIKAYFEKLKCEISDNIDNLQPKDKALALTKI